VEDGSLRRRHLTVLTWHVAPSFLLLLLEPEIEIIHEDEEIKQFVPECTFCSSSAFRLALSCLFRSFLSSDVDKFSREKKKYIRKG